MSAKAERCAVVRLVWNPETRTNDYRQCSVVVEPGDLPHPHVFNVHEEL